MSIAALLHRYASLAYQALLDAAVMVFVLFLALLAWAWELT